MKIKYLNIFYRFCNCIKFPNSVGMGPFSELSVRYLFNKFNINKTIYPMSKNKYLNIFTGLIIVLNFQADLELSHTVHYHRVFYSMNYIYQ